MRHQFYIMKKIITLCLMALLISLSTHADVTINSTNFPDANFRIYLLSLYPSGYITTAQINSRTTIDVSNRNIYNLTGIKLFTALQRLYCYSNNLTSLDVSNMSSLYVLNCQNNPSMTSLYCYRCNLDFLSVSTRIL